MNLSSTGRSTDSSVPAKNGAEPHSLLTIFLRGGMDGLSAVVPYFDAGYYAARPTLAVAEPGSGPQAAHDLDGRFGLHPALQELLPCFHAGDLAIVHAAGNPAAGRSHFVAQDLVSAGMTRADESAPGWSARYLAASARADDSVLRSISISSVVERSFIGWPFALAIPDSSTFELHARSGSRWGQAVRGLHDRGSGYELRANTTLEAISSLAAARPYAIAPEPGAAYPANGFGRGLQQAAQYIKSGVGSELMTLDLGGWDHHVNLATRLPPMLNSLAAGLAAFRIDLGARFDRVTTLVISEFGRRVRENSSAGTDHGRGTCIFVLGGGVRGGRIYGDWPGLAAERLHQGDLEIGTDHRQILAEILERQLRPVAVGEILPGYDDRRRLGLFG